MRIYTHTLKYQCNISFNYNEQYKKEIGYDSKLWESNPSKLEHKIIIMNDKSEHKINPN